MKKYVAALMLVFSMQAYSQTSIGPAPPGYEPPCFGPGGCQPGVPAEPVGPHELCLPDGCVPVSYLWEPTPQGQPGEFVFAYSALVNGYPLVGYAGPCLLVDRSACPDIKNQAFADLLQNAKRANRAQRF